MVVKGSTEKGTHVAETSHVPENVQNVSGVPPAKQNIRYIHAKFVNSHIDDGNV